jgi:hypothetical protein
MSALGLVDIRADSFEQFVSAQHETGRNLVPNRLSGV